ncbi:SIMPL domain-containing protein [Candidatus Nomurabacteria bacterium]|nr:SIMPL domain-containing protein [Candidatus Nomurabacteria bacterium]
MNTSSLRMPAVIIAAGVIVTGLIIAFAAGAFSGQGKFVEVKGLSEQIVKANQGIWSMSIDIKSNDVTDLYNQITTTTNTITQFLLDKGFEVEEINSAPVNVYQDTYREALYRYNANLNMSVYTDKVDLLRQSSQETAPLIQNGIVFNSSYVDFQFTDINDVKPAMLAEAIGNARAAAQQFADDAGTRLGAMARADQGVFSITDKDQGSPEYKKVRVVSSVRYLLK